jgi:hypothetical protein
LAQPGSPLPQSRKSLRLSENFPPQPHDLAHLSDGLMPLSENFADWPENFRGRSDNFGDLSAELLP